MSTPRPRPKLPKADIRDTEGGVHLTKIEKQRMKDLWVKAKSVKAEKRRDAQPTFELLYLGLIGRIKNRGAVEGELAELKKLLDKSAALMVEIMDKSERKSSK